MTDPKALREAADMIESRGCYAHAPCNCPWGKAVALAAEALREQAARLESDPVAAERARIRAAVGALPRRVALADSVYREDAVLLDDVLAAIGGT